MQKYTDKLYPMNIETFFFSEDTNNKMKWEARDYVFAKNMAHKGLLSTICKELWKVSNWEEKLGRLKKHFVPQYH